ncbi:prostaglandin E2 receptor EP4 subtype-like [Pecten maximus]|uniref:prostaglandin E2 receptor EP4 subtype-like n=1 Tax=Pecten maximus TaxID=6579 RepID=UPI001458C3BD|nr:prostaglandin E2 receptor EP4 subtype-like [Pecten maximus]XP_033736977.1 prostaglandin E2 receptor EP4 subtype-like [Pecten maximus]
MTSHNVPHSSNRSDLEHIMAEPSSFNLPAFCNYSDFEDRENETFGIHHRGATILSPVLMGSAGIIGNILALYVLHKNKSSSVFYTLVAGLAWTDLSGIILTSPVTILSYSNGRKWVGGEILCKFNGFVMICFGLSTPLIVCAMAIERFLAIKYAMIHSQRCTYGCARIILITLWITTLVFGVLPLFGVGIYTVQYPCTWCFLDFHSNNPIANSYGYLYASVNLAVVLIMTSCNCYVMFALLRVRYLKRIALSHNGNLEVCEVNGGRRYRRKKKNQRDIEFQMIILMCVLTTVFGMCWAPLMVQIIVTMATGSHNYVVDLTVIRLASLNQTLDPWIYILLRKTILDKLKQSFRKICCFCCPNADVEESPDQNAHAHHLKCFRKQYNNAGPQHLCHYRNIPVGSCRNHSKKCSKKSDGSRNKKHSLPDVMREAHSRSPPGDFLRPDVAAGDTYNEICNQCQSTHSKLEKKSSAPPDLNYINNMAQQCNQVSDGDSDSSSSHEHCNICSGVEESQTNDVFSEPAVETLESELFLTKTTTNSGLGESRNLLQTPVSRQHLYSDVIPSFRSFRLPRRKSKRIKSAS